MFRSSSWYFLYKTKFTYCLKKNPVVFFFNKKRPLPKSSREGCRWQWPGGIIMPHVWSLQVLCRPECFLALTEVNTSSDDVPWLSNEWRRWQKTRTASESCFCLTSYCNPSIWKRTGSSRTHGSNARRLKEAICGTGKSLPIWLEFESFTNLWLKMTPESFSSIQMAW